MWWRGSLGVWRINKLVRRGGEGVIAEVWENGEWMGGKEARTRARRSLEEGDGRLQAALESA